MPHDKGSRIPGWSVQQAYSIEQYPIKPGTPFALTEKLNGVRATFFEGKLISRTGIPFTGMEHITDVLREFAETHVFDGELTLRDKTDMTDNEAFRVTTGLCNADSDDKTAICYTIFDAVPLDAFPDDSCPAGYFDRRMFLDAMNGTLIKGEHVRILPVLYQGTDQSQINALLEQMVAEDKEGLIINLDTPYRRKRHRGILKVKRFYTMDLPITGVVEGTGRLSGTLGALTVDFDGTPVNVGTGFTDEERNAIWTQRNTLPGILCEVKYKEISKTKTGRSLQFPVFVRLRTDKTETSYS